MESTKVVVTHRDGVAIIALAGEHDIDDAGTLRMLLNGQLAAWIVLDLSRTEFVDSTVIATILSAHRCRQPHGGVSVVLGGGIIKRMFEIMRLEQVLRTFPSASAALAELLDGSSFQLPNPPAWPAM